MAVDSIVTYVAENIRNRIIKGRLNPGQRIKEKDISSELNVSTPPLREAFKILESEGLIELIPRRGAIVANVTSKDVWEVYTIIAALYVEAMVLATERILPESIAILESIIKKMECCVHQDPPDIDKYIRAHTKFHDTLLEISENHRLKTMCSSLRNQVGRYSRRSYSNKNHLHSSFTNHKKIFEAINDNNIELAKQLTYDHVIEGLNNLLNIVQQCEEGHNASLVTRKTIKKVKRTVVLIDNLHTMT